jgi:hypothetical protein
MTAEALVAPTGPGAHHDVHAQLMGSRSAGRGDRAFRALAVGAGLLVLVILAGIALTTTREAWPAFQEEGLGFIFSTDWAPAANHFGAGALIYGTLLVSAIALVLAVPFSLGIALFATELAGRRLRGPLNLVMDLLAAIPSVIYGLWAVMALGVFLEPKYGRAGPRGDPLGDDPRRGVPVVPRGHHRCGHARPRPGDGRDDRRRPHHRQQRLHHHEAVRARRRHGRPHRQPVG